MKKLLVTGASGFLGWNVCSFARKAWNVIGTVFSHSVELQGCTICQVDLTDYREVKNLFLKVKPEAVIHTAAESQPNNCQNHPNLSYKINVLATKYICSLCADKGIPFVYTSSDLVFNETKAPYREEDSVSPLSIYGEQKVESERIILSLYPEATVCRNVACH